MRVHVLYASPCSGAPDGAKLVLYVVAIVSALIMVYWLNHAWEMGQMPAEVLNETPMEMIR